MKNLIMVVLLASLVIGCDQGQFQSQGIDAIPGDSYTLLFDDRDFAGLTTFTSPWVKITKHEKFSLFIDVNTDSVNFATAINDSLNSLVKYEMFFGDDPVGDSPAPSGFWPDGQSAGLTAITLTIADTLNGGRFYATLSSGNSALAPGAWIRAIVTKSTGHVLLPGKLEYDLGIWFDGR